MLMTEIRKEEFCSEEQFPLIEAVAEEAATVLGYTLLKERISTSLPLLRALSVLNISLLNLTDVEAYKKERRRERGAELFAEFLKQTQTESFYMPNWNMQKIEEYRQPIPEFVLAKAIEVKKACPEAVIFIEHLDEHPDPFLVVKIQTDKEYSWSPGSKYKEDIESYHIEVWAEPKFENKL